LKKLTKKEVIDKLVPEKSCMDCNHHKIIYDPDPEDWFCDDDVAVVCLKVLNKNRNLNSKWESDHSEYKAIACSIRPYNIRRESIVPQWCPLINRKDVKK
jgi:hypothetical protein|tara:strand:- start:41 stop:340 length:300 start_codon:yes stop_codon:yes gene_type:complete